MLYPVNCWAVAKLWFTGLQLHVYSLITSLFVSIRCYYSNLITKDYLITYQVKYLLMGKLLLDGVVVLEPGMLPMQPCMVSMPKV